MKAIELDRSKIYVLHDKGFRLCILAELDHYPPDVFNWIKLQYETRDPHQTITVLIFEGFVFCHRIMLAVA
jgi:hypothetical protein